MRILSPNFFAQCVSTLAPRYYMRLYSLAPKFDRYIADGDRALEIGPGQGDLAEYLTTRFPSLNYSYFENSVDALQRLSLRFSRNDRVESAGRKFSHIQSHARFDVVLAFEVLEHVQDDESMMRDIHFALEDEGVFIMSVPAKMSRWQIVDEWAGHVRRYEKGELQEKLAKAGFDVVTLESYGFPITELIKPVRDLFYSWKLRHDKGLAIEQKTSRSGVDRISVGRWQVMLLFWILYPFSGIQSAVRNYDFGDGYLVVAKKRSGGV